MKTLAISMLSELGLARPDSVTTEDKIKEYGEWVLFMTPIAYFMSWLGIWFDRNQMFFSIVMWAILANAIIGLWKHWRITKEFTWAAFLRKNAEMMTAIFICYFMLDMLRYTAGENVAGEIFRILIQVTTLLYPVSKVLKNIFIITDGEYPPKYIMERIFNFEKNGDLKDLFRTERDHERGDSYSNSDADEFMRDIKEKRKTYRKDGRESGSSAPNR